MTDHDLRDLLHDQVADVTSTSDLSAQAWGRSRGVRRRRALGVVGGSAAAAVLVVGGIAVLGDRANETPDPAPRPTPEVVDSPDAMFERMPVYWSPTLSEESDLSVMSDGRPDLPEVIDLSADAAAVEADPIERASAAYAVLGDRGLDRLLLLTPDGGYRTLDVSDVEPHPLSSFGGSPSVSDAMLSPTGEYLVFPQLDGVMVYDLPDSEWRRIDTGDADTSQATWSQYGSPGNAQLYLPQQDRGYGPLFDIETGEDEGLSRQRGSVTPRKLEPSSPFGPNTYLPHAILQSWGSGVSLPVRDGTPNNPEFLTVSQPNKAILTFTGSPGGDDRWLQCCPVVGWIDSSRAMYESRSGSPRIIAWTVGTDRFETVSTITGFTPGEQSYVASYRELWR